MMKTNKYFLKLTFCSILLALCACQSSDWNEENTLQQQVAVGKVEAEDKTVLLSSLTYTIALFRAETANELNDASYQCLEIKTGLTKAQAEAYSFKMSNHEIGLYAYQLFIHAAPLREGKAETEVLEVSVGSSYPSIEVGMVKKEDGSYVTLSKDNYYSSVRLLARDMKTAIVLELPLKRLVGQLVFDFFKSDALGTPLDIDAEFLSTLDRVTKIDMQMQGMTTRIKLAGMMAQEKGAGVVTQSMTTMLEHDYRLNVLNQRSEDIGVVNKTIQGGLVKPVGGARVFSTYLLPTGQSASETLKAHLALSYYDTPSEIQPAVQTLDLNLPSSGKVLNVLENCYTVTNIRLKNNRVIDLNASGGVDINTDWD